MSSSVSLLLSNLVLESRVTFLKDEAASGERLESLVLVKEALGNENQSCVPCAILVGAESPEIVLLVVIKWHGARQEIVVIVVAGCWVDKGVKLLVHVLAHVKFDENPFSFSGIDFKLDISIVVARPPS